MNPIVENIMALHDEAAEAAVDYVRKQMEPWHQQAVVDDSKQYMERRRQALRTAIEQALNAQVPEGYVLVPVKPTEEMIYAAQVQGHPGDGFDVVADYEAMLAAAPQPQPKQDAVGDWIWAWLMDYCKSRGVSPILQSDMFAMVKDARFRFDAAPAPQPQREWVGLDDADLANCDTEEYGAARYWEAKLREKNGGGV